MFDQEPELEARKQSGDPGSESDPFFGGGVGGALDSDLDDAGPGLGGPGLFDGRGFDDIVLNDLEPVLADAKDPDALQQVFAKKVDDADAFADQVVGDAGPVAKKYTPPPSVKMAEGRDKMRAQIETSGATELEQLEAAHAKQLAELDTGLTASDGKLDRDITKEKASVVSAQTTADGDVGKDVAAAKARQSTQIEVGHEAHAREAETHLVTLGMNKGTEEQKGGVDTAGRAAALRAKAASSAQALRAQAQTDAAHARGKAAQAQTAATTRANAVDASERKTITDAAARRTSVVDGDGEARALAILARAEQAATKIVADGNAAATQIETQHAGTTKTVAESHNGQKAIITTSVTTAHTDMQAIASDASTKMDATNTDAKAKTAAAQTGAGTAIDGEKDAAAKKRLEIRADAAAKLDAKHAAAKAKVEAKTSKLLDDLAKTDEKDLKRVSKQLGRELYELEQSDGAMSSSMKRIRGRADAAYANEVAKRRYMVRMHAQKAKATIAKVQAAAKHQIRLTDQGAKQGIAQAAWKGLQNVKDASKQAFAEQKHDREERTHMMELTQGSFDAVDTEVKSARTDMDAQALVIDKKWGESGAADATAALTAGKPVEALNLLTSLTPEAQGMAVDKLDDAKFKKLLKDVPASRHEEFETLIRFTTDPERKLQLWEKFHAAETKNDIAKLEGDPTDTESARRHERRVEAGKQTTTEMADEAKFLRAQKGGFTADQVDELMARKGAEHDMEMKYNLNITNETGKRADGSKIVWTKKELDALEGSFTQLPEDHLAGNEELLELRREDVYVDEKTGKKEPTVGGTHRDGIVKVMDNGAKIDSPGFRHGGDAREMASPTTCSKCGVTITQIDMVVTHEIGHDIHDKQAANFDQFKAISGWGEVADKTGLKAAGLTDAEIAKLERTRKDNYKLRNEIHKDGKVYMVDPYDRDGRAFLVVDEAAIPKPGEAEKSKSTDDTWAYARSNHKDHFAELYAKSVHVPKKLYEDLVTRPEQAAQLAHDERKNKQGRLDALKASGATADEIKQAQEALDEAEAAVVYADQSKKERGEQRDLMRNEVFGTKQAETDARARLAAKGVTIDQLLAFDREAAIAMTPEQIQTIEAKY